MDDKLSWSGHSNAVDKKIQYRRGFLRKRGSFKVCNEILFCECVFGGVLVFTCVCWRLKERTGDRDLDSVTKKASSLVKVLFW